MEYFNCFTAVLEAIVLFFMVIEPFAFVSRQLDRYFPCFVQLWRQFPSCLQFWKHSYYFLRL
jgi:hypothetical protein